MDENVKKRNECLAQTVIKGLQSRNMSGYYAPSKEAALKQALELIPQGSSIAMGGCMSAHEIGLRIFLNKSKPLKQEITIISTAIKWSPEKVLWLLTMQMFFFPVQMPLQMTVS